MKVEKTVNIVLEPEEKEIVNKFDTLISNICSELCCDICPLSSCAELTRTLAYLKSR